MKGFVKEVTEGASENKNFRHVLSTGLQLQVVLVPLASGEHVFEEVQKIGDQYFRVGKGRLYMRQREKLASAASDQIFEDQS